MRWGVGRSDDLKLKKIRTYGPEIVVLGSKGLDSNAPSRRYGRRNLPREFSGLHPVSVMYAVFQKIASDSDVGIDFAGEYAAARGSVMSAEGPLRTGVLEVAWRLGCSHALTRRLLRSLLAVIAPAGRHKSCVAEPAQS